MHTTVLLITRLLSGISGAAIIFSFSTYAAIAKNSIEGKLLKIEPLADGAKACLDNLSAFSWICSQFDDPSWIKVFGYGFWERGTLTGNRADLDEDGSEDLLLRVNHTGYCGTAGCTNFLLFGDLAPTDRPRVYGITSGEEKVYLIEREGSLHLRFGDDGYLFSIPSIREKALSSAGIQIGG